MGIRDSYTSFCLDEAASYIVACMKEGQKPVMDIGSGRGPANYKRPSDLYNKYKKEAD